MIKKERLVRVEIDARRNLVNLFHEKSVLCGETIDAAMEDPKMEAIFANTEVENYLDCIIRLVLEKNEEIKKLKHALRPTNGHENKAEEAMKGFATAHDLLLKTQEQERRIRDLEMALKHIATEAGKAVHR